MSQQFPNPKERWAEWESMPLTPSANGRRILVVNDTNSPIRVQAGPEALHIIDPETSTSVAIPDGVDKVTVKPHTPTGGKGYLYTSSQAMSDVDRNRI